MRAIGRIWTVGLIVATSTAAAGAESDDGVRISLRFDEGSGAMLDANSDKRVGKVRGPTWVADGSLPHRRSSSATPGRCSAILRSVSARWFKSPR